METPSSTRRVTRSQTLASSNNTNNGVSSLRKLEESESVVTKSRQRNNGKQQYDRSPLIDITNDSPIVGLAIGSLETPSSAMSKKRFSIRTKHDSTPGSGEALLRGQVKTLLQKVEEEAELSKLTFENRPSIQIQGFIHSPLAFVAPTPANTPQILNPSANGNYQSNRLEHFSQSGPEEDEFVISQMVSEIFEGHKEGGDQSEKNLMITRSLLLDFSEKSEGSSPSPSECLSEVTTQGGDTEGKERTITTDDDASSIWSIQVNASTRDDQEDEEEEEGFDEVEEKCDNDYLYEEEDDEDNKEDDAGFVVDELCEAISQMNVNNGGSTMATFAGKHIRFLYNSDDELEGEVESESAAAPPLNLKGLPAPEGKHLRFPDD